jgi:hypothetical protein
VGCHLIGLDGDNRFLVFCGLIGCEAAYHGVLRWQNGGSQVVSFCRWVSAFYLFARSFATTYNLKGKSQKPSETDGPEHTAKNNLATLRFDNKHSHCRISENGKRGLKPEFVPIFSKI